MLGCLSLLCRFSDDEGHYTIDLIIFYDQKLAETGLNFGDES
jgi:hypothetical protein